VPVLGICLGHQLAAVALGGRVRRSPHGQRMGLLEMGWTAAAASDPLLGAVCSARRAVQWNNDVVSELPAGAEVLASTADGEVQAARLAPTVWGVQCHPEAGAELVGAWAANDGDSAARRGVDVDEYVAQVAAARNELRTAWHPLAGALAAMDARAVGAW
jgi:GMP synthase (glutamine-hydrolysing)